MSGNRNLTLEDIKTHSFGSWNWTEISKFVSSEIIKNNPSMPWCHIGMSSNSNMRIEDMEKINFRALSKNTNLTFDFLNKHIKQDWDWEAIYRNPFILEKELYLSRYATKIQRWWAGPKGVYYNPKTKIRKEVNDRKYNELYG